MGKWLGTDYFQVLLLSGMILKNKIGYNKNFINYFNWAVFGGKEAPHMPI